MDMKWNPSKKYKTLGRGRKFESRVEGEMDRYLDCSRQD